MTQLYISPAETENDSAAICAAVEQAVTRQVGVVAIRPRRDGKPWHICEPVCLPSFITVIIDGCTVEAETTAFVVGNAKPRTLGGESHKVFILGRHGGAVTGLSSAPQIRMANARDCRIAELSFMGGSGIDAEHLRYSKLQQLKFRGSRHGVTLREGCNNIILESLDGETAEEAILLQGGENRVMGRKNHIYNSILCRIRTKTQGAPAVRVSAGEVPVYNIVLRDITDETDNGTSVIIGGEDGKIRDITVRGVDSRRNAVRTEALCDGMFYSNLRPGDKAQALVCEKENTRQLLDDDVMEIVLPQFPADKPDRPFLTPNDPAYFGTGDADTIQNAVNAAAAQGIGCVVIPRWNVRAQQPRWDMEKAVKIPSDMTVVFLQCHLRQTDFTYENMFCNSMAYHNEGRCIAHEEHDLTFTGIGDAVLDGGMPNGLLEKTCNMYGLPDKRLNATLLFNNVRNLVLENFQIRQSRWYGTYFIHCDTCRVSGLDFDAKMDCCNRDGVDMRSGCHNFLVENITGSTGDDTVALNNLGNDGNDGRYVEGKDPDTLNMVIRNIKSDAGRWFTVRLLCQDRHLEQNFVLDTIMDASESENKKGVQACVMIGSHEYHYKIPAELGDLAHLTIRDVYSRSPRGVSFGGCSDDVTVSNCHSWGDGYHAISVSKQAYVRDIRVKGVFHKRDQKRLLGANTTDVMLTEENYEGCTVHMHNLRTENPVIIEHVYADTAGTGVEVTGGGQVQIRDFHIGHCSEGRFLCDGKSDLTVNGEKIPGIAGVAL